MKSPLLPPALRTTATLVLVSFAHSLHAQNNATTLALGGEQVTLTVSAAEIFTAPRVTTTRLTAAVQERMQAQALTRLGERASAAWKSTAAARARPLAPAGKFSGGVIVPRTPGVPLIDLTALLATDNEISQPVYLYNGKRLIATDTVTARFRTPPSASTLADLSTRHGFTEVITDAGLGGAVQFRLKRDGTFDPISVSRSLAERADVAWAEPDFAFEATLMGTVPNDPFLSRQWYLDSIKMSDAWALAGSRTTQPVVVAVLDDGVDLDHPDLKPILDEGYDFVDNDKKPNPVGKSGHGTACAGLIAAISNNGIGIAGIAPTARILPVRVADESQFIVDADLARAIRFAQENGARVISCSWGGGSPSSKIIEAIDAVSDRGCLVVVAAGNARPANNVFFPARYERCFAIGSLTRTDVRWDYSCYGPDKQVDLTAPSGDVNLKGDIWTTDVRGKAGYNAGGPTADDPSGNYAGVFGGTSAATPVVAGVAAWLWSFDLARTGAQIRTALEKSALRIDAQNTTYGPDGKSRFYGFGKVNPAGAFQGLMGAGAPTSDPIVGGGGGMAAGGATVPATDRALRYVAGGENVELQPDATQVAVLLPGASEVDAGTAGRVRSFFEGIAPAARPATSKDRQVWLVPKARLDAKAVETLMATGATQLSITPVYRSVNDNMDLVVATGSVTVRPNDASAATELKKLYAQAGAAVKDNVDGTIVVGYTDKTKAAEVPRLLQLANESKLTKWAEPDLIRSVR